MCSKSKTRDCTKFLIIVQLESVPMSVCPSKLPYVCPSVSLSIFHIYELLLYQEFEKLRWSREEFKVAGFFIFSHIRMMGYFR